MKDDLYVVAPEEELAAGLEAVEVAAAALVETGVEAFAVLFTAVATVVAGWPFAESRQRLIADQMGLRARLTAWYTLRVVGVAVLAGIPTHTGGRAFPSLTTTLSVSSILGPGSAGRGRKEDELGEHLNGVTSGQSTRD